MLAGRDAERAEVLALLDNARASRGTALVLRGVPGVGKSTLVEEIVSSAIDATVLRTSGVESESQLAFAALHRLLRPVIPRVSALPRPQASALRIAFGEEEGEGDRFLVFLATLSLLAEAAEHSPVVAVVDDAHWLDSASKAALLFVARRLNAERVALLFAVRESEFDRFDGHDLPSLALKGLDAPGARDLLESVTGSDVSPDVAERLVVGTQGNPLALVEIAASLTADQLGGTASLPPHLALAEGAEAAFLARYLELPEPAQTYLLIAAADDSGQVSVVNRAALALELPATSIDAAVNSGLARLVDDRLELRHPLVRSSIYRAVTDAERRAVHFALAHALAGEENAGRRAWHLAASADQFDEVAGAELVRVAERASRSGGHEAASAAWERAAELTASDGARAALLLAAAEAAWLGAQPARAHALAEVARPLAANPVQRADIDRLRARIEWNVGSAAVGHRILLQGARDVAAFDPHRAREMAMMATAAAAFGADSGVAVHQGAFLADQDSDGSPRSVCVAKLLEGFAEFGNGRLDQAAAAFRVALAKGDALGDVDLLSNLGNAAMLVGDDVAVLDRYGRLAAQARESGAIVLVLYALTRRAVSEISTGDWAAASAGASEALDLARGIGRTPLEGLPLAWLALLAALGGRSEEHAQRLAELEGGARGRDDGLTRVITRDVVLWAKGVDAAKSPAVAFHHLDQISHVLIKHLSALDRIEAAVRSHDSGRVSAWADELDAFAEDTGARWAAGIAAHGRALLAEGAAAEAQFGRAIEHHAASNHRTDAARARLAFGEFLRRSRRRVDARAHLRAALEVFEDLGAESWAERARQELRASGESARRRDPSTLLQLTPQEIHVVRLVAQGRSNRDVAAQLFLSPRTVDFHLRNVFTKVGVASRAELMAMQLA